MACVRCVALLGQARCTTRRTSSTWTVLTTWLSWTSTLSRSSTVLGTTFRPMPAGILSDKWWLVGTGTASSSGCRWTIHRRVLPTISPTKSKKSNGGTLSLSPLSLSFSFSFVLFSPSLCETQMIMVMCGNVGGASLGIWRGSPEWG